MNPFKSSILPEGFALEDYQRMDAMDDLARALDCNPAIDTMICCPKGYGKTTLKNYFFTPERIQSLAAEKKLLVTECVLNGTTMATDFAVISELLRAVTDSVKVLETAAPETFRQLTDALLELRQKEDYRAFREGQDYDQGRRLVEESADLVKRHGYGVTLVIDDFHNLTTSRSASNKVLGNMASLSQVSRMKYIVFSDCHPNMECGDGGISPFVRIFDNIQPLPGVTSRLDRMALTRAIQERLAGDEAVCFSQSELRAVFDATGGVPALLQKTLSAVYAFKQERDPGALTPDQIEKLADGAGRQLMEVWTRHLEPAHKKTLRQILTDGSESAMRRGLSRAEDRSSELVVNGFVRMDPLSERFSIVCPMLERYLRKELDRPEPEKDPLAELLERTPELAGEIHIHNEQISYYNTNNIVINTITPGEILDLLEDTGERADYRPLFADRLSRRLQAPFAGRAVPLLDRPSDLPEADFEQQYDEQFGKFGSTVFQDVELDEDAGLNVPEEQIKTLDARFQEARSRIRQNLTDLQLSMQSVRCQFYLKLSVVVEDALSILDTVQEQDYSPHLVLYGKALEQGLRDNFFPLFSKDAYLRAHNCYDAGYGLKFYFGQKRANDTFIGNYAHMIQQQQNYLSALCRDRNGLATELRGSLESAWWDRLQQDIHKARELRNLADHANSRSPQKEDLDMLATYLLGGYDPACGEEIRGILERSAVGQQLMPDPIPLTAVQELSRREVLVIITDPKADGRITARTVEGGYPVKISKRKAMEYCQANAVSRKQAAPGQKLLVRILDFAPPGQHPEHPQGFFSAEILRFC